MPACVQRHRQALAALAASVALLAALPASPAAGVATAASAPAAKHRASAPKPSVGSSARTKGRTHPTQHQRRDEDLVIYGRRDDAMRLAAQIAGDQGLDRAWVEATLAQARFVPAVARLILPPAVPTVKNWAAYRERFVEPERIAAGVAFWNANQRWLDAARTRYGVEPEVIVGIIGVETFYGRHTGRFRVLDALATLSLDFPAGGNDRSAFFRAELAQWLVLARREGLDAVHALGSYAGAIGLGQFMPGSINRYAVDFDADGHVDMNADAADVIGSIARYLADNGWRSGLPTHYDVTPPPESSPERALLLGPDIEPRFSAAQFAEAGAVLSDAGKRHEGPLALVELRNGDAAPSHVAGSSNFYAITRYNRSSYYAMAVIDLGQAAAAQRLIERLAAERGSEMR